MSEVLAKTNHYPILLRYPDGSTRPSMFTGTYTSKFGANIVRIMNEQIDNGKHIQPDGVRYELGEGK